MNIVFSSDYFFPFIKSFRVLWIASQVYEMIFDSSCGDTAAPSFNKSFNDLRIAKYRSVTTSPSSVLTLFLITMFLFQSKVSLWQSTPDSISIHPWIISEIIAIKFTEKIHMAKFSPVYKPLLGPLAFFFFLFFSSVIAITARASPIFSCAEIYGAIAKKSRSSSLQEITLSTEKLSNRTG